MVFSSLFNVDKIWMDFQLESVVKKNFGEFDKFVVLGVDELLGRPERYVSCKLLIPPLLIGKLSLCKCVVY